MRPGRGVGARMTLTGPNFDSCDEASARRAFGRPSRSSLRLRYRAPGDRHQAHDLAAAISRLFYRLVRSPFMRPATPDDGAGGGIADIDGPHMRVYEKSRANLECHRHTVRGLAPPHNRKSFSHAGCLAGGPVACARRHGSDTASIDGVRVDREK